MAEGTLLRQVLLNFCRRAATVRADVSAIAYTPDGHLWIGSDELTSLERLSATGPNEYGDHQQYAVGDYIDLQDTQSEIDIEGMDYADGYLWLVGSHSTKRKRVKRKADPQKNIQRLQQVGTDANRYLLARLPIVEGVPVKRDGVSPTEKSLTALRTAARLESHRGQSALMAALEEDEHIGPILKIGLPSKDNGFDIEALAARKDRLFLGLRGPVLRGMAIVIEIEVEDHKLGLLRLKKLENNQLYRKHFVDLNGLGVRDMCFQGDDLIILAGATMQLDSVMQVFRFKQAYDHSTDTLWTQSSDQLVKLFDLSVQPSRENAEGITLFPQAQTAEVGDDDSPALMVVYDSPLEARLVGDKAMLADVLKLSKK
ncbi:MAG: DUF3616 domain-containing protein [Cyanobacteria bacterium J06649_4]